MHCLHFLLGIDGLEDNERLLVFLWLIVVKDLVPFPIGVIGVWELLLAEFAVQVHPLIRISGARSPRLSLAVQPLLDTIYMD